MPIAKEIEAEDKLTGAGENYGHGSVLGLLTSLFTVSLVFTVTLAYICTAYNPTDVLVQKQRELRIYKEPF